ncbi:MAG: hypothetical protein NZM06_10620 [Chloroherpetonaceae bacterium]|nr:hypothetical protein [Chloroherpetonaceae bacterium]MDW8438708.1 hypothetical protein [Chloroherpetonaceae bacterium]
MATLEKSARKRLSREARRRLLEALTYETHDAKPVYYRGYKKALRRELEPEAIMGSGYEQSFLISLILRFLFSNLPKNYQVLTNEIGLLYGKGEWKAADIAIFERSQLQGIEKTNRYLPVPPKVVIEVDTKADLEGFGSEMNYCFQKTQTLLDFGVEKVIWFFTSSKKAMQAERGKDWTISDWNATVSLLGAIHFSLDNLIRDAEQNDDA